jgi:hypothetical protein
VATPIGRHETVAAAATELDRATRDLLQDLGRDHQRVVREFAWPDLGDRFKWAIDWFDANARGQDTIALWIVQKDGPRPDSPSARWRGIRPPCRLPRRARRAPQRQRRGNAEH